MTATTPEPEVIAPCAHRQHQIANTPGKPERVAPEEHIRFRARGVIWCQACDVETPASVAKRQDVRR